MTQPTPVTALRSLLLRAMPADPASPDADPLWSALLHCVPSAAEQWVPRRHPVRVLAQGSARTLRTEDGRAFADGTTRAVPFESPLLLRARITAAPQGKDTARQHWWLQIAGGTARFGAAEFSTDDPGGHAVDTLPLTDATGWPSPRFQPDQPDRGVISMPPLALSGGEVRLRLAEGGKLQRALAAAGGGAGAAADRPRELLLGPDALRVAARVPVPLSGDALEAQLRIVRPPASAVLWAYVDWVRMSAAQTDAWRRWWRDAVQALGALDPSRRIAGDPTARWLSLLVTEREELPSIGWPLAWSADGQRLDRLPAIAAVPVPADHLSLWIDARAFSVRLDSADSAAQIAFKEFALAQAAGTPHGALSVLAYRPARPAPSSGQSGESGAGAADLRHVDNGTSATLTLLRSGGGSAVSTAALALAYDPRNLAERLRRWQRLPDPAKDSAAQLSAFMPLDQGWLQWAVPNLARLADSGDGEWLDLSPQPDAASVLDSDWRITADDGSVRGAAFAPWSFTVERAEGASLKFVLDPPADAAASWSFKSAELGLQRAVLSVDGLLWLGTEAPGSVEALPTGASGAAAFESLPLRIGADDPASEGVRWWLAGPLKISAPAGGEASLRAALAISASASEAGPKAAIDAWMRHPSIPLAAQMSMLRAGQRLSRPSETRELAPFRIPLQALGPDHQGPLVRAGLPVLRLNLSPARAGWPRLVWRGRIGIAPQRSEDWPWGGSDLVTTEGADSVRFAAVGVPGVEFAPRADGSWRDAEFAYRFDLPLTDELFAISELPVTETGADALPSGTRAGSQAPPEPPAAPSAGERTALASHWIRLRDLLSLTRVQSSYAFAALPVAGDATAVSIRSLLFPFELKTDASFASRLSPLSLGRLQIGQWRPATGNEALMGRSGTLALPAAGGTDITDADFIGQDFAGPLPQPAVPVLGWSPAGWRHDSFEFDMAGIGRSRPDRGEQTPLPQVVLRPVRVPGPSGASSGVSPVAATATTSDLVQLCLSHPDGQGAADGQSWLLALSDLPLRAVGPAQAGRWCFDSEVAAATLGDGWLGTDTSAWTRHHAAFGGFEWRLARPSDPQAAAGSGEPPDALPFFGLRFEALRLLGVQIADGAVKAVTLLGRLELAAAGRTPQGDNLLRLEFTLRDVVGGRLLCLDSFARVQIPRPPPGSPAEVAEPSGSAARLDWPLPALTCAVAGRDHGEITDARLSAVLGPPDPASESLQLLAPSLSVRLFGVRIEIPLEPGAIHAGMARLTLETGAKPAAAPAGSPLPALQLTGAVLELTLPGVAGGARLTGQFSPSLELTLACAPKPGESAVAQFRWITDPPQGVGTSNGSLFWFDSRLSVESVTLDHARGSLAITILDPPPKNPADGDPYETLEPIRGIRFRSARYSGAVLVVLSGAKASADPNERASPLPGFDAAGVLAELSVEAAWIRQDFARAHSRGFTRAHHRFEQTQRGKDKDKDKDPVELRLWGFHAVRSAISWPQLRIVSGSAKDAMPRLEEMPGSAPRRQRLIWRLTAEALPTDRIGAVPDTLAGLHARYAIVRPWTVTTAVRHRFSEIGSGRRGEELQVAQVLQIVDLRDAEEALLKAATASSPAAARTTLMAVYRDRGTAAGATADPAVRHPGIVELGAALAGTDGRRFAEGLRALPGGERVTKDGLLVSGMALAYVQADPGDAVRAGTLDAVSLPLLAGLGGDALWLRPAFLTQRAPADAAAAGRHWRIDPIDAAGVSVPADSLQADLLMLSAAAIAPEWDLAIAERIGGPALRYPGAEQFIFDKPRPSSQPGAAAPAVDLATEPFWLRSALSIGRLLSPGAGRSAVRPTVSLLSLELKTPSSPAVRLNVSLAPATSGRPRSGPVVITEVVGFDADAPDRLMRHLLGSTAAGPGEVSDEAVRTARIEAGARLSRPVLTVVRQAELPEGLPGMPPSRVLYRVVPTADLGVGQFLARSEPLRRPENELSAGPQRGWARTPAGGQGDWLLGPDVGLVRPLRDPDSGVAGWQTRAATPSAFGRPFNADSPDGAGDDKAPVWFGVGRTPAWLPTGVEGLRGTTPSWLAQRQARQRLPAALPLTGLTPLTVPGDGAAASEKPPSRSLQAMLPPVLSFAALGDRCGVLIAQRFALSRATAGSAPFDNQHPRFGRPAIGSAGPMIQLRTPRPGPLPANVGDMRIDRRLQAWAGAFTANARLIAGPAEMLRGLSDDLAAGGPVWAAWFAVNAPADGALPIDWNGEIDLTIEVRVRTATTTEPALSPRQFIKQQVIGSSGTGDAAPFSELVLGAQRFRGSGRPPEAAQAWQQVPSVPPAAGQPAEVGMLWRCEGRWTLAFLPWPESAQAPSKSDSALAAALGAALAAWRLGDAARLSLSVGGTADASRPGRPPQVLRLPLSVIDRSRPRIGMRVATLVFTDPAYERTLTTAAERSPPQAVTVDPADKSSWNLVLYADRGRTDREGEFALMVDVENADRKAFYPKLQAPKSDLCFGAEATAEQEGLPTLELRAFVDSTGRSRRTLHWVIDDSGAGGTEPVLNVALQRPLTRSMGAFRLEDGSAWRPEPGDRLVLTAAGTTTALLPAPQGALPKSVTVTADTAVSLAISVIERPPIDPPPAFYGALMRRPGAGRGTSLPMAATAPMPERVEARDLRGDLRRGSVRRGAVFRWIGGYPAQELDAAYTARRIRMFVAKFERSGQGYLPESEGEFAACESLSPPESPPPPAGPPTAGPDASDAGVA